MGVHSKLRTQAGQLQQESASAVKSMTVPRSLGPFLDLLLTVLGPVLLDWLKEWLDSRLKQVKQAKTKSSDQRLTEIARSAAGQEPAPVVPPGE